MAGRAAETMGAFDDEGMAGVVSIAPQAEQPRCRPGGHEVAMVGRGSIPDPCRLTGLPAAIFVPPALHEWPRPGQPPSTSSSARMTRLSVRVAGKL